MTKIVKQEFLENQQLFEQNLSQWVKALNNQWPSENSIQKTDYWMHYCANKVSEPLLESMYQMTKNKELSSNIKVINDILTQKDLKQVLLSYHKGSEKWDISVSRYNENVNVSIKAEPNHEVGKSFKEGISIETMKSPPFRSDNPVEPLVFIESDHIFCENPLLARSTNTAASYNFVLREFEESLIKNIWPIWQMLAPKIKQKSIGYFFMLGVDFIVDSEYQYVAMDRMNYDKYEDHQEVHKRCSIDFTKVKTTEGVGQVVWEISLGNGTSSEQFVFTKKRLMTADICQPLNAYDLFNNTNQASVLSLQNMQTKQEAGNNTPIYLYRLKTENEAENQHPIALQIEQNAVDENIKVGPYWVDRLLGSVGKDKSEAIPVLGFERLNYLIQQMQSGRLEKTDTVYQELVKSMDIPLLKGQVWNKKFMEQLQSIQDYLQLTDVVMPKIDSKKIQL